MSAVLSNNNNNVSPEQVGKNTIRHEAPHGTERAYLSKPQDGMRQMP